MTRLAELAGLAQRRPALAPWPEAAQGELGGEQYQRRLRPGAHRPAGTVMLAYSGLAWRARQQRRSATHQARRGDPVSPSADISAQDAAGRAS